MKRYINSLLSFAVVAFFAASCSKNDELVVFQGGKAPEVKMSNAGNPVLTPAEKNSTAFNLSWTNPAYSFSSGISSQDVSYSIQIDTVGANFTNPNRQEISVLRDLSRSFTVAELNTIMAKMSLSAMMPHNLQMRVVSTMNGAAPLTSNVVTLTGVVPYEDFVIPVPASNKLFITGAATPGGWQAGSAGEAVPANQEFTQVSRGIFEIPSLYLNGDQSYLLLPEYGSWAAKYGGTKGNNENNPLGDDFKANGSDLKAPATSGNYKIQVNFIIGRFTVTKL